MRTKDGDGSRSQMKMSRWGGLGARQRSVRPDSAPGMKDVQGAVQLCWSGECAESSDVVAVHMSPGALHEAVLVISLDGEPALVAPYSRVPPDSLANFVRAVASNGRSVNIPIELIV